MTQISVDGRKAKVLHPMDGLDVLAYRSSFSRSRHEPYEKMP
jgi:hypothetical protein